MQFVLVIYDPTLLIVTSPHTHTPAGFPSAPCDVYQAHPTAHNSVPVNVTFHQMIPINSVVIGTKLLQHNYLVHMWFVIVHEQLVFPMLIISR